MDRRGKERTWLKIPFDVSIAMLEKVFRILLVLDAVNYDREMSVAIRKAMANGYFIEEKAELGDLGHIQASYCALVETLSLSIQNGGTYIQRSIPL